MIKEMKITKIIFSNRLSLLLSFPIFRDFLLMTVFLNSLASRLLIGDGDLDRSGVLAPVRDRSGDRFGVRDRDAPSGRQIEVDRDGREETMSTGRSELKGRILLLYS